jgi:type VI secretion system protein VasJ
MEVDQKIISLACSPISDAAPCGINAKYEAPFERLEAEISKSESLNAEATDWTDVLKLSEEILSSISKDYSVACYLAYAYIEEDGFKGLFNGLALIEKLSETFWDDMYPPKKRLRGRQNATQWLVERVARFLASNEPSADEMALIPDTAKTLKNLDYFLADKMEDKAPNFSDISRPIKRLKEIAATQIKKAPEPVKAVPVAPVSPAPEAIKAPEPAQPATAPAAPIESAPVIEAAPVVEAAVQAAPAPKLTAMADSKVVDVASDAEAKKAYKQIQDGLRKLANFYGQVKSSDPKRFRLSRSALWDGLDKLPPVTDNKSQLPAPPADKLKKVKDLFESGDFLEAINLGEKSAEKMPYWFEGNRYIAMSLDALGAEYSKAKSALEFEITKFTSRLPKILDLQYANGTAFADDQTKAWLASLSSESTDGAANSGPQDNIQETFVLAKKLALSGKLSEGFSLLNTCAANTKRDRFKIKMACAELACINGQEKVGIPMLERLVEETRTLTAAEWESDFVAKALALLVNAYEKLNDEKSLAKQKQIDAAYDQLCWYNPALLTEQH